MLPNLRPSILHRHRKSASLGAEESSEKEHKADEAYWQQKRSSKAHTEERLRKSLYGRPEEYQQEVQEVEQQRVKEKQALKQKEEEAEVRWHSPLRNKHKHEVQQIERPWTIAALSIPEHVADRARRARQQEDNEANRRAAAENMLHKRMHQEQLRRSVRQEQSAEDSFFNFGAASEKWIAPELRVKRIHAPAVHHSSVFRTDSNASSLQVSPRGVQSPASATPSRAAPVHKNATGMQHPWAWDAEPMHSRGRR
ncbi:g4848 [Coccomyxa elongata]